MRELKSIKYDGNLESDKMLYKHDLLPPDKLNTKMTYLYGQRTNRLPLLFATEGQGNVSYQKGKSINKRGGTRSLNDTQYTWPIMGNYRYTDEVVKLITPTTTPGLGMTRFKVAMRSDYIPPMYSVTSPDKEFKCRVEGEPEYDSVNNVRIYTFVPMWTNPDMYVTLDNFIEGRHWSMGAPTAAPRRSDGNRFNSMYPGELTNQFGIKRYSLEITGNIANKITPYEMDTTVIKNGVKKRTTTRYYLPFQMTQFEMTRRELNEESLWYDEYNRDENGIIQLTDENGEEVPQGAGVIEQIKFVNNYETYYKLTPKRLTSIIERIRQLAANKADGNKEIAVYGGGGAVKMFNDCLMDDAMNKKFFDAVGTEFINKRENGFLQYGNGFTHFKLYDGTIVSIQEVELFNSGPRAQADRANGRISEDGFPYESYNMVFIDHSTYEGDRNLTLVREKGREVMTGVYTGMTPLPGAWSVIEKAGKASKTKLLSTTKDMASYEIMETLGIVMKNATTSWFLKYQPY